MHMLKTLVPLTVFFFLFLSAGSVKQRPMFRLCAMIGGMQATRTEDGLLLYMCCKYYFIKNVNGTMFQTIINNGLSEYMKRNVVN